MASFSRPRRAFWSDARFLVGILLVVLSVAGVWLIVSSSARTTPVLQATRTIVKGETLSSGDFQVVDVALGRLTEDYLGPQDLAKGRIAARTIDEGELLPRSASAAAADARTTTMVVESSTRIPDDVSAGTVVELWQAPPIDGGRSHEAPRILVSDVIVSSVVDSEGMLASEGRTTVEVVIDRAEVADVLAAITGGALVSVVPVGAL
ncbi:SAF domain-containing protein [Microbacterium sp. XT11]|uniref:SAF domain-containing protein n=1 Tax=Microbacterium sp. XT11 TaxID=367477 RepID=UPI000742E899|nr:SAF domain-containing protein [Microbacterium sp. XT11]ALX66711.1 hypothetical protein AB663_002056 [Microbacterium sp. XT11]